MADNLPAHSHIGASSMYRWSQCPGSVRLCKTVENRSSSYAEEGTRAHEMAAFFLESGRWPGGVVDQEMRDNLKVYVDAVCEVAGKSTNKKSFTLIEHKFDLSTLFPGLFGTADAVVFNADSGWLHIFDLKYGAGVPVEVEGNEQLLYYGLGALMSAGVPCETVELVVVQPRCPHPDGPVRRWSLPAIELLDFAADVVDFAKRTEDPNAPLVPGEHCRFCPAAGICPAVHSKALAVAKEEFRSDLSYDPEKLARTLQWIPIVKAWANSVWDFAFGEAMNGRCPPGFKLVQSRSTRSWKNADDAARFIQDELGASEDEIFDRSLRSPAKIEKLLSKEEKIKLAEHIVSESSGVTLAPESDKRPPAKVDAKTEFAAITETSVFD